MSSRAAASAPPHVSCPQPTLGLPSYHPLPENIEEARDERPAPRSNARGQEPGGSPPAITMRAGGGKGGPRPQEA